MQTEAREGIEKHSKTRHVINPYRYGQFEKMIHLLPFKKIKFTSSLPKEEIIAQLNKVIQFTRTKNFFNSTTSDYLYSGYTTNNSFDLTRITYSRKPLGASLVKGKITDNELGTIIDIEIRPSYDVLVVFSIFLMLPIIFTIIQFGTIFHELFLVGLGWALLGYIIGILAFNYDIGQIEDFFEYKILKEKTTYNTRL